MTATEHTSPPTEDGSAAERALHAVRGNTWMPITLEDELDAAEGSRGGWWWWIAAAVGVAAIVAGVML